MDNLCIVLLGSMDQLADNADALVAAGYKPRRAILPSDRDNTDVSRRLAAHGIETVTVENLNSDPRPLTELKSDLVLCYAFPQILKQPVIAAPRLGVVNFHTSDLPAYRGRHPVNWAFINGEPYIGLTAHFINESIDDGDIILRDRVAIERDDDIVSVLVKLGDKTKAMTIAVVRQLANGTAHRMPQDRALASYQRRRAPNDSHVDWTLPGHRLHRFVNGLAAPYPNAYTAIGDTRIHLQRSYCGAKPGEIIARTTDGRHVVATVDGVMLVKLDRDLNVGDILG